MSGRYQSLLFGLTCLFICLSPEGQQLDIKKSSYKKVRAYTFLACLYSHVGMHVREDGREALQTVLSLELRGRNEPVLVSRHQLLSPLWPLSL